MIKESIVTSINAMTGAVVIDSMILDEGNKMMRIERKVIPSSNLKVAKIKNEFKLGEEVQVFGIKIENKIFDVIIPCQTGMDDLEDIRQRILNLSYYAQSDIIRKNRLYEKDRATLEKEFDAYVTTLLSTSLANGIERELEEKRGSVYLNFAQNNVIRYYDAILKIIDDIKLEYDIDEARGKRLKEVVQHVTKLKNNSANAFYRDEWDGLMSREYVDVVLKTLVAANEIMAEFDAKKLDKEAVEQKINETLIQKEKQSNGNEKGILTQKLLRVKLDNFFK